MRESLGWITNCSNDAACPQNWLELSVTECPAVVPCHVCGRSVDLVLTEDAFDASRSAGNLAGWPVVPCVAIPGRERVPTEAEDFRPSVAPPMVVGRQWVVRLQGGETIALNKDTMIVGRSRTCDIVIPSAKVSRQHASVTQLDGGWYIEDLGSANGVWLNGEKVTRNQIRDGEVYTISDESLSFSAR